VSGRRAKAARRASPATRAKQQDRAAQRGRRTIWLKRRRKLYWPSFAVVAIAILATTYLARSGSDSPPAENVSESGYHYAVGTPGVGQAAPPIKLPSTAGGTFDLASYKGKQQVLLYFQEGLTCQPCWDQIAALQQELDKFRALGVGPIVSVTTDPLRLIKQKVQDEGLEIPVLSDSDAKVSDAYDARTYSMTWMSPHRDGHTFILVGRDGRIRWRADYGGPPKYTMFLPVEAVLTDLRAGLETSA
jgi:peroxiredoxin